MTKCEILIIDDDQDDIEILREALLENGVEKVQYVHCAMDAFHYLDEVYADCIPGLIVTDFVLPGMSGAEFFMELITIEKYKEVKVVILSTTKFEQQIEYLRKLGRFEFFTKPTHQDEYAMFAERLRKSVAN